MEKLEAEKLSAERERQKIEKEERENLRKQQQAEDNLPPEPAVGTAGVSTDRTEIILKCSLELPASIPPSRWTSLVKKIHGK